VVVLVTDSVAVKEENDFKDEDAFTPNKGRGFDLLAVVVVVALLVPFVLADPARTRRAMARSQHGVLMMALEESDRSIFIDSNRKSICCAGSVQLLLC